MERSELISKIISKKEFSKLPLRDVEMVFESFDKEKYLDSEKVKLSRNLLRKMYTAFVSSRILNVKDKDSFWVLKKHISTKERLIYFEEIYSRILKDFSKVSVIDLGAGVNGFSYPFFDGSKKNVEYLGVEAVGQLVDFTNYYFEKNKFNAKSVHASLFDLRKILGLVCSTKTPRVIFLFKTLDSLEMLRRDYSKELVSELSKKVDRIVVSFATKSLVSRKSFHVQRNWFYNFLKYNYKILDEFELGGEKYISFCRK